MTKTLFTCNFESFGRKNKVDEYYFPVQGLTRVIIRVKLIWQNFAYALIIRVRLITIFPKKQGTR